jgi:XRE family transcriptional regulator, aerobic/anaerobic benzoate catabolism transcriptional regulator
MLLTAIGARLKRRRAELGLTQAALAREASVSPRFLVQLEKGEGNISVQRLHAVCAVLQLPLERLFRGLGPDDRAKLALVGLRGAGKSTIGAQLAARLDQPFVELDRLVEDAAGMSLGEIFEIRGQEGYREIEVRVLDDVLAAPGGAVIATGGSLVTAPDTWARLRAGARTAWLRATPASHLERVMAQGDLRPMRGRPQARAELEGILDTRAPLYAQADVSLDTDALGVQGAVDRLAAW